MKAERLHYLDWLRVLAFWLLILFHSWQPFNHFHWLIKSDYQTVFADVLTVFTHGWRLHLIFLVSGVGTWFALKVGWRTFYIDRVKRLVVPFIFGAIVIVPIQRYFQNLQDGIISPGFLDFLLSYPRELAEVELDFSLLLWFKEVGIHLWYLPYLLVMTAITYPLLVKIKKHKVEFGRLDRLLRSSFGIFILALPIFVFRLTLKPIFPAYTDWADLLTYVWCFLYGFCLMNNHEHYISIIRRNERKLLICGLLASLCLIVGSSQEALVETYLNPSFKAFTCSFPS